MSDKLLPPSDGRIGENSGRPDWPARGNAPAVGALAAPAGGARARRRPNEDRGARSTVPHQKLALTLVGLVLALFTASAAHTETITKHGLFCRHRETFHQYMREPDPVAFYSEQFRKGECAFAGLPLKSLSIGTEVRMRSASARTSASRLWVRPRHAFGRIPEFLPSDARRTFRNGVSTTRTGAWSDQYSELERAAVMPVAKNGGLDRQLLLPVVPFRSLCSSS